MGSEVFKTFRLSFCKIDYGILKKLFKKVLKKTIFNSIIYLANISSDLLRPSPLPRAGTRPVLTFLILIS